MTTRDKKETLEKKKYNAQGKKNRRMYQKERNVDENCKIKIRRMEK